jgi:MoaA/NifB/PqqE/SkfB family radical SAM enzyme
MDGASTVHFVTNASLLNFDRIERLTRLPVHITISMDGATKETFEAIRAGGNFDLILEKLAMIKKMRDINLSDMRSHFCFNFVALRRNIHELPDLIRLAHRFNIPKVHVADYAFNNNEFDEQSLRYEPLKGNQYLHEALDLARELGIPIVLPPDYGQTPPPARGSSLLQRVLSTQRILPKRNRFPARCSSPWKEPYVRTDGLVTPCCSSGQKLGHLQHATFAQVWNGWRYRMLRWRIESVMPPIGCRICFVSWGINGGNPGNVMAQEGLLLKALYWLELRGRNYARRLIHYIRSLRATHPAPPAQQPNFKLGRPWKPTPQKQPQP